MLDISFKDGIDGNDVDMSRSFSLDSQMFVVTLLMLGISQEEGRKENEASSSFFN